MRNSDWTQIYWDGGKPYVRFIPVGVELEKHGFPHGISLATAPFRDIVHANEYADRLDKFFDAVRNGIIKENKDQLVGYH